MLLPIIYLLSALALRASTAPADSCGGASSSPSALPSTAPVPAQNNSTTNGTKYQATVTGYQECLTQGMACGLTGSPGKTPTAAMSGYLIPSYGKGVCGSCWKLSNPRNLNYHGQGQLPTIGGPLDSPQGDGMVVLINNACAPGKDQYGPGEIGQCTQTTGSPRDKLGSQTVLDLCADTNAVQMMWGTGKAGLAVADVEEVDCGEWGGVVRHVS